MPMHLVEHWFDLEGCERIHNGFNGQRIRLAGGFWSSFHTIITLKGGAHKAAKAKK